jgi:hypothetical protein
MAGQVRRHRARRRRGLTSDVQQALARRSAPRTVQRPRLHLLRGHPANGVNNAGAALP